MVDGYVNDCNLAVNTDGVKRFNEENGTNENLESASKKSYQAYTRYLFSSRGS